MEEIRFCENNFEYDIEAVIERIEDELTGVNIEVEACLGECGICSEGPFAIVNGDLIKADSADDLFDMIKEKLGM